MQPEREKYTYTPDEDAQDVGPGMLSIKVPGTLRVEHEPAPGQSVELRAAWIDGVGVRPVSIKVESHDGKEVTSTDLRAVKAKDLWREGMAKSAKYIAIHIDGTEVNDAFLRSDDQLERLRLQGPTYGTLAHVVELYTFADSIGLAPVQYVQKAFAGENLEPIPRTTVTKWIKRAKDQGLFEEWFSDDGND